MATYRVNGGIPLQGKVRIQGSKNAALPVLAATLLSNGKSFIRNCPQIADVHYMIHILENLGCTVRRKSDGLEIDPENLCDASMTGEAIRGMRSSLCLLGAMLGRFKRVQMEYPGGCVIGERPIDLHLKALEEMGAHFTISMGSLTGETKELRGTEIILPFPSVGATENILLAGVMAAGETRIVGAAKEPEVVALCQYLEKCGAHMDGIGTSIIRVSGGHQLTGAEFEIPADRIVAGTYLFACVGCGGCVFLENAPCDQLEEAIRVAESMGAACQPDGMEKEVFPDFSREKGLYVQGPERPRAVPHLKTQIYPGFPTDLQSVALTVLTVADGKSCVEETLFENRFRIVEPLNSMGADVRLYSEHLALVCGVERLAAQEMTAYELRGGAALVVAALMAQGESQVVSNGFIERGYENICKDLQDLGVRIISV